MFYQFKQVLAICSTKKIFTLVSIHAGLLSSTIAPTSLVNNVMMTSQRFPYSTISGIYIKLQNELVLS